MLDSMPQKKVTFTLNGKDVTVIEGTSIWAAAKAEGELIPHLCHKGNETFELNIRCSHHNLKKSFSSINSEGYWSVLGC